MYLLSAARWVDRVQSSTIWSFFFYLILYIPQKNDEWKIGGVDRSSKPTRCGRKTHGNPSTFGIDPNRPHPSAIVVIPLGFFFSQKENI